MALAKIADNKRHLTNAQGEPHFLFGVNYYGYFDRMWRMWGSDWFETELIERDFRKASHSGFNTVRLIVDDTLAQEVAGDNFKKLTQVVDLAEQQNLGIILTLNGHHQLDLATVSQLDAKIATQFKDSATILAYDLENEPTFYHLAAATYPDDDQPAIQTSQLVDHYGVKVARDEVADLQRRRLIPAHLTAETAFYYINALHLFREYDAAIKDFEGHGRGTLFDYLISDEAAYWHPLIGVLESTVETWLQARIEPLRAVSEHLLTVSWGWPHLALLPANRLLDFQSYHYLAPLSLLGFNTTLNHLHSLRRAFPDHPILLTEFGWSNQTRNQQPVDPQVTALYEGAMYSYLRADAFGGGCKANLNDVPSTDAEGYEAQLGVFKVGDEPKPISGLVEYFAENWPPVEQSALFFSAVRDVESGLTYRFDLPQQIAVGGRTYQDNALSWKADDMAAHCFLKRDLEQLIIESSGAGQLSIDPWNLVPIWHKNRTAEIFRVYSETSRTRQETFAPGETVVIDVHPGAKYLVKMGLSSSALPVDSAPQVEPQAGEHVLLLADADNYLPAALKYIRRFAPDLSFTAEDIADRWPYVTVVASAEQVPEETLEAMRAVGTRVVERLIEETPEATQTLLDDLAQRGQRFSKPVTLSPTSRPVATNGAIESYLVQPGDSLDQIADRIYGNFQLWPLIFEANQDQLTEPTHLRAGMTLRIPERD